MIAGVLNISLLVQKSKKKMKNREERKMEGYIYRFNDEGSEWSLPLKNKEECIRHATAEQFMENTNFESILVAYGSYCKKKLRKNDACFN